MKYFILVLCSAMLCSCVTPGKKKDGSQQKKDYYKYSGPIQGTMFNITFEWHEDLAPQIDSLLQSFNESLSNYDPNSQISKINNNQTDATDELVQEMLESSLLVYQNTDGAFDITVAPIVNAWGFAWDKTDEQEMPTTEEIDSILQYVGMDKVQISNGKVVKDCYETQFVTNAIAQGLSVDYVSDYLKKIGLENFLVEIGGEVYCYGNSNRGTPWRIGIDKPIEDSGYDNRENQIIINLSGRAIATSGNYRKFVENNGEKVGHSIDPRTGYFAENSLLSASVVSSSCMLCDAYATSFMVSGLEKSLEIIEKLENTEAYFIYQDDDGDVKFAYSSGFQEFVVEE